MRSVLKIMAAGVTILALAAIVIITAGNLLPSARKENIALSESFTESAVEPESEIQIMADTKEIIETETEIETKVSDEAAVTLLFGGDVYLSEHVLNAYDNAKGISGVIDTTLLDTMRSADIFMVNEEFPFSTRGVKAEDKQYTFRVAPERAVILKELGIDIVSLANNHGLDYGTQALEDTFSTLDGQGIEYAGAGVDINRACKLIVRETGGKKTGFLAATRVVPLSSWGAGKTTGMLMTYDPALLLEQIKAARTECDYLVVFLHWGIERETSPKEYQRTLGKQILDAGADIVIGSHPHVLQGIEYYNGKPIIYSLGNLIFGSSIPKTALLKLELECDNVNMALIPATSAGGYTKALTEEKAKKEFYDYMTSLSYGAVIDADGIVSEMSR